ncbi:MAG: metal-sensing transcriptional repressor [Clostridia bacterium]|nr:metal-sensing transcriptional repressor [Clostridia bacterium]MBR5423011.1 metal-sensing transcriptional repressor [Clostridia bacterium]
MKNDCCCERTKIRTDEEKKRLVNRLSRIEGQIRGIKGMIEKDAYCADVLTQSAAVSAAVDAFNRELLSSHIRTCVVSDIRSGKDETVEELNELLKKLM